MAEPLVSIALCVFNGEKYIKEQLESILEQTYQNLEIIILDDGSTDNSYKLLTTYAESYDKIKLFRNTSNKGLIKNFETAINHCKGEYIALCDQDDIWLNNKIQLQIDNIGSHQLIYHDSQMINELGNSLDKKISDFKNLYDGDNPKVFLLDNCISGHSILMKTNLAKIATPFPKGVFHDWWLAFLATNVGSITYLNQCLVRYRQHPETITSEMFESKLFSMDNLIVRLEIFRNHPNCKIKPFIDKLMFLDQKYKTKGYSLRLPLLLIGNLKSLYWISKKTFTSKIFKAVKFSYNKNLRI